MHIATQQLTWGRVGGVRTRQAASDIVPLTHAPTTILQINIGLYCNQACVHCHVESSPLRTEAMSASTIDEVPVAALAPYRGDRHLLAPTRSRLDPPGVLSLEANAVLPVSQLGLARQNIGSLVHLWAKSAFTSCSLLGLCKESAGSELKGVSFRFQPSARASAQRAEWLRRFEGSEGVDLAYTTGAWPDIYPGSFGAHL